MPHHRRIAAAVLAVVTLSACGGSQEPPAPATQEPVFRPVDPATLPPVPAPGAASGTLAMPQAAGDALPGAMVTDMASGWPVVLRVGQELTARLTADRAAGGRWSLRAGSDGGIVAVPAEPAHEPGEKGGAEVFRIKATKSGSTTLTFDYKVGSSATPARSVSYPVTVQ